MDSSFVTVLMVLGGLVVAAAIGAGIWWFVRRQQWIKALEGKGWAFESSPGPEVTFGMNVPPFGVGFGRGTDELITGTTPSGAPFRSFEYQHDGGGEQRVICVALPVPVPEAYVVTPDRVRPGTQAPQVGQLGNAMVLSHDADWGAHVQRACGGALDALAAIGPVDLSTDGRWLVANGAGKEPDALERHVAAVDALARSLVASDLTGYATVEPPPEQSFHGRPTWCYRPRDDRYLSTPGVSGGGQNHETHDVMLCTDGGGVQIIAFRHTWETTRTVTDTDSEGRTRTRTETDHHEEPICSILLPFPFGDISMDWFELFGDQKRTFESIDFHARHKVRAADGKLASDVFHPRMMEWLLARPTIPFRIEQGHLQLKVSRHDPNDVWWCADFAQAFLRRVPDFVWHNLGVEEPSFRQVD